MKTYRVLEQHFGDKQYWPGDTRELLEADAADLLAMGLIGEGSGQDDEKAAKQAAKAEKAAKAAAEKAAKEAAAQAAKEQAEPAADESQEKADGGGLLDKAEAGAPQNKAESDGND